MGKNVRFKYSSSKNINFNGEVDSGVSREDWESYDEDNKTETMIAVLWDLVDLWVEEEDD